VAGRAPDRVALRERDLSRQADTVPTTLAQVDAPAAAPPPAAPLVRADDTLRVAAAVAAEAGGMRDTSSVANRASVADKLGGVLAPRRSVADASARFAEPAAPQARPPATPEPTAPRLVSEERIAEVGGRVVVRRVYQVEETLVTLDERAPRDTAQRDEVLQQRLRRIEERAERAEAPAAAAAPSATIRWVDSRGAQFTLSGPVPREQLERFRKLLGY
jgi:hypothetical protein